MDEIELVDVDVTRCEELEDREGVLYFRGSPVARLKIDRGWTRWYDNEGGGGYGTVRNTGYFYCGEAEFRKYAAEQDA